MLIYIFLKYKWHVLLQNTSDDNSIKNDIENITLYLKWGIFSFSFLRNVSEYGLVLIPNKRDAQWSERLPRSRDVTRSNKRPRHTKGVKTGTCTGCFLARHRLGDRVKRAFAS